MSLRSLREARRYLLAAAATEATLAPLRVLKGRLLLVVSLACLVFFRDPARPLALEPDILYAPADGTVTGVETVSDHWLPGGEALRISTFLALYDVHVNRSPVTGRITAAQETPGAFAPAFLERAHGNHSKRLAIEDGSRRVVLVQFAGMLARRIASWVWLGDRVDAGQRVALIHLGSRADVLVPAAEAHPLVCVGQRVRAGVTPIAHYLTAQ
ncbi:MAG: phosphatidylserine decarboxylase [Actinomycetota bacterium]|nr:phosphatidylserine decarboxylase [Actinomycetota bacterium]